MNKDFHGLVLVDKPSGITSHDVVARLRRILKTKSIGHSGTLDPMASGLMVCLVNEGTKLSQYILEGDKSYRLRAQLGISTDTLDITGAILQQKEALFNQAQILQAAEKLIGEFEWEVPIYSAIKVQGQKLYDYARADQEVKIPTKIMKFYDLQFLELGQSEGRTWCDFEISCSKGSYIRTWADQLGKLLGSGACLSALRRIHSTPYNVDQGLTLEQLEEVCREGNWQESSAFIPLQGALPSAKKVRIRGSDEVMLRNGQISHDLRSLLIAGHRSGEREGLYFVQSADSGRVLALVTLELNKGFVLKRVFHYPNN